MPVAPSLIGRTLGAKFLVRHEIGHGGMGSVYEVEHVLTKRVGALKLLHPRRAAQSDVVARFVREASAASHIGNAHIVATYDAGELPSGEPYLFMELLEGSPISALIDARGRLPFELSREIVAQAAEGLAAAHVAGIVHRDVKPENLFLCEGQPPFVKVLDFGISKFAPGLSEQHQLTLDGSPMGSPHYMSPEQAVGKRDIDFRTDVYSLGVVLYECLTGEVPFSAESLIELGVKIFEGRYTPPSELVPELPLGLDALVARAMALEPSARFESMAELGSALRALGAESAASPTATLVITPVPVDRRQGPRRRSAAFMLFASLGAMLAAVGLGWRAFGGSVEPSPTLPSATASVAPELIAPVTRSAALPPATVVPAPVPSTSVVPRAPRPANQKRAVSVPSSRAGRDGLVEANPFP